MDKPSPEQKAVPKVSTLFKRSIPYTPKELRDIADDMESKKIQWVKIDWGSFSQGVLETPSQAKKRYQIELARWEKWLKENAAKIEKKKQKLIADAKKFGLYVSEFGEG